MTPQRFSIRLRSERHPSMVPHQWPQTEALAVTVDVWVEVTTTGGRDAAEAEAQATAPYVLRAMQARVVDVEVHELSMEPTS